MSYCLQTSLQKKKNAKITPDILRKRRKGSQNNKYIRIYVNSANDEATCSCILQTFWSRFGLRRVNILDQHSSETSSFNIQMLQSSSGQWDVFTFQRETTAGVVLSQRGSHHPGYWPRQRSHTLHHPGDYRYLFLARRLLLQHPVCNGEEKRVESPRPQVSFG